MPKTSVISARIDPNLKQNAEQIFTELGLTASQAITLFYKQVKFQNGLPFQVNLPNNPSNIPDNTPNIDAKFPKISVHPQREVMLKEQMAFDQMKAELLIKYLNQHVAIFQGKVVDHDIDRNALLERRQRDYPNDIVLLKKVLPQENSDLHFHSIRFVQDE